MEKSIWFKRKTYGWGWTPANAAGWIITLAFIGIVLVYPVLAELKYFPFREEIFWVILAPATAVLIAVCYWKGESPRWSWGDSGTKPRRGR
jgi:hypothetical protein